MEARSRRVGGGFPGYNGPALPRAVRSSRGRGQSATRTSRYGGHSGFFELLATVAGQILQEDCAGEEQELVRVADRDRSGGKVRQKCTDSNAQHNSKDPESSPIRAAITEQQVQSNEAASSAHTSCLESLGEAIRDDEARNLLLSSKRKESVETEEEGEEEDIGADSVHSVVNKPVLSRPLEAIEECPPQSPIPQETVNNEKLHLVESGGSDLAIPTLQQPQTEKQQMTSSVSDNDENHTIKSDPDSSISTAVIINKKHKPSEGFDKMQVVGDTDEAEEDSVQTPKAEEAAGGGIHINKAKAVSATASANAAPTVSMELEQHQEGASSIMGIVAPTKVATASSVIPTKAGFDCPVQDPPLSSTVTDVAKAELSSDEVMHPPHDDHLQLKKQQDKAVNIMNLAGTKKGGGGGGMDKIVHGNSGAANAVKKPWKKSSTGFYGKDDEGESGLEIDDKCQLDAKKLLKNVIFGKLDKKGEAGSALLSEFILGNAREMKKSSKRNNICGSPKPMFPVPSKMSSKPAVKDSSYAKGMRARKVVKMVKRSRVSSSRSKRKHADMDAAGDSDEGLPKKAYYSGLSYTRQRTSRGFPAKRKKMVDNSSAPGGGPDLHVNTSNLMDLGFEYVQGEPPAAAAKLRSAKAASVASSPTARGCSAKLSKKSGEPHVKLAIKSFTVPELSVDLPESATVLSLKRAVMDAAMNLLGGGLRVRVLLQGKKVPDEGATLAQVGISRAAKPDTLGFMLEPSPSSPTSTSEDPLLVLSRAAGQPSPRYPLFGAPTVPPGGELGSRCPKTRSCKTSGAGAGAGTGGAADGDVAAAPYGAAAAAAALPGAGDRDRDRVVDGKRNSGGGLGFPDDVAIGSTGCAGNHNINNKHSQHHHHHQPQQQQAPKSGSGSGGGGGGGPNEQRMSSLSPHSTRVAAVGALAAIRAQADAARRASKNEAIEAAAVASGVGGGVPVPHHPHSHSNSHAITAAAAAAAMGHESSLLVPVTGSGAIILHAGSGGGGAMTTAGGEGGLQGLALVPVRQKSHSLDVGKRRVRRPFSVSEVEALVHAVEKLGTGRWRDVKLRAFDQAKHRTYVDLKDKWKTLVHTARIAPHQRRGEPVPQELLERVTRAHSYWTAHAAKQQAELDY